MIIKTRLMFLIGILVIPMLILNCTTPVVDVDLSKGIENTRSMPSVSKLLSQNEERHRSIFDVPEGSFILGINEHSETALIGNRNKHQLLFLDLQSGNFEKKQVHLVPQVALPLRNTGEWIIFGYEFLNGSPVATSNFLSVRNEHVKVHELVEPILVRHGIQWVRGGHIILGDEQEQTLVFIEMNRLEQTVDSDSEIARSRKTSKIITAQSMTQQSASNSRGYRPGVPIGRQVLEGTPYHFKLVSKRHLAVSYSDFPYLQILDLEEPDYGQNAEFNGEARCSIINSFPNSQAPFFVYDRERVSLYLLEMLRQRNDSFSLKQQLDSLSPVQQIASLNFGNGDKSEQECTYNSHPENFGVSGLNDQTIWVVRKNELNVFVVSALRGASSKNLVTIKNMSLPIFNPTKIHFFDKGRRVAISDFGKGKSRILVDWVENILER